MGSIAVPTIFIVGYMAQKKIKSVLAEKEFIETTGTIDELYKSRE
jgi:hypothetical protein